ncbi:MAG: hypothetical protein RL755_996, partial [Pseudomonadota bacterium]
MRRQQVEATVESETIEILGTKVKIFA